MRSLTSAMRASSSEAGIDFVSASVSAISLLPRITPTLYTFAFTPNLLPAGRPAPYMIFENLTKLAVPSLDAVIKVGDTIADILEGVNAKVYSVGVILGSNEMALTEAGWEWRNNPRGILLPVRRGELHPSFRGYSRWSILF